LVPIEAKAQIESKAKALLSSVFSGELSDWLVGNPLVVEDQTLRLFTFL
jgi:hypothetical protein